MEKHIGQVTHYFGRIQVAVLDIKDELCIGDRIHIDGHTTKFSQPVTCIEVDHKIIQTAKPGMDVAIKVADRVRAGDQIYKIVFDEPVEAKA